MRRAFTLIELVLVLVILAAVAAMVIPLVGGLEISGKAKEAIVTETTMRKIRDAIMGTRTKPGAWPDLGQRPEMFPSDPAILLQDLSAVQQTDPSIQGFDPVTKIGWRGPYFAQATGKFDLARLHSSFGDDRYGAAGGLALVDAWGNPIVIQVDFNDSGVVDSLLVDYDGDGVPDGNEADFARLVSAGPNGILDTPYDPNHVLPENLTSDEYVDDILLFLRRADTRP